VSEHAESKTSPVAAIIMLLIIAGLVVFGIALMNSSDYVGAGIAGGLLFLFGLVMVLKVGKP
jgi:hypothetical protein